MQRQNDLQIKLNKKYKTFIEFAHKLVNATILKRKRLFSPHAIIKFFRDINQKDSYPQKNWFYHLISEQKYGFEHYMFPNLRNSWKLKGKRGKRPPRYETIHNCIKEANLRLELGHMEVDAVEGGKSDKFVLATMIDCKSLKVAINPFKNKNPQSFLNATVINLQKFSNVKTITMDSSVKNALLWKLKNIKLYSTNSYSAWQKGSVENMHKFIRRIKPKSTTINNLKLSDIQLIEHYINAYPRKLSKTL